MKTSKKMLGAMVCMSLMGTALMSTTSFAYDEYLNGYSLGTYNVTAKAAVNRFGDVKTEQSYYRTGGDVKVITRDEIEKRHYGDITDAIKRVPGVTFQNPGYRGGEYGYQFYNNGVSINGDSRVVILVDGRRIDNSASTRLSGDSTSGSKSTGVNLDQITNINNVDKIEVIKGAGASVYGSDATGGVINIITREGGDKPTASVDVAVGNWGKRTYSVAASGPVSKDKKTRMFVAASNAYSGDTEYVDGITKTTGTLTGSRYNEKGADIRITHDFDDNRSLDFSFNFKEGRDGYPLATVNQSYWNAKDWNRMMQQIVLGNLQKDEVTGAYKVMVKDKDHNNALVPATPEMVNNKLKGPYLSAGMSGNTNVPGYATVYALDGAFHSYSKFNNRDFVLTYNFKKDKDIPSFIRVYHQDHYFASRDIVKWYTGETNFDAPKANIVKGASLDMLGGGAGKNYMWRQFVTEYPNGAPTAEDVANFVDKYLAPFPGDTAKMANWIKTHGGYAGPVNEYNSETSTGVTAQVAKVNKSTTVIGSLTYDHANMSAYSDNGSATKDASTTRNTLSGYVQAKVKVTPDFLVTPAIRFAHYSGVSNVSLSDDNTYVPTKVDGKGGSTAVTGAVNSEFKLSDTMTGYFGLASINRPLRPGDYAIASKLNGPLKAEEGMVYTAGLRKVYGNTVLGANYAYTDMSNAIATLPAVLNDGSIENNVVNAKETKSSFNFTVDHTIGEHWTISAAYTHLHDNWKAKGFQLPANYENYLSLSDVNTMINQLRPNNRYSLNIAYQNNKLYTGLLANLYAGNNRKAFTADNFLVLDWSLNYNFNKNTTAYIVVNNLTNEAYQLSYSVYNGIDTASMPARSYMFGMKYTF